MRKFALVVGAVLGLCGSAFGQDVPRAEVFGGYSYLNIDTNGLSSRQSANGWEAAISGNFNNWFGVEGDVAGYYKTIAGVSVRDYSYAGGPRCNYRQLPSVTIFGHALLGGDQILLLLEFPLFLRRDFPLALLLLARLPVFYAINLIVLLPVFLLEVATTVSQSQATGAPTPRQLAATAAGVCLLNTALLYRDVRIIQKISVLMSVIVVGAMVWIIVSGILHFDPQRAFDFPRGAFAPTGSFWAGLGSATLIAVFPT